MSNNGHGGARPNSGRPRTNAKYLKPIGEAMDLIAANLDSLVKAHIKLALGGYPITDQKFQLACTLKEIPPGVKPADMVLVEEKTRTAEPNGAALASLLDRVAGRPPQTIDLSMLDGSSASIPAELAARYRQVAADYAREMLETGPGARVEPSRN